MSQLLVKDEEIDIFYFEENYKRGSHFVRSPFRYPGGKYYALKYIIPLLECVPHQEYREPFIGGGSVFFAKRPTELDWINDLETDLIETYKVISKPILSKELSSRVSAEVATKERHAEIKEFDSKSKLELAYKTYYLNRTSYSGIINKPAWGYRTGKSSPPENWPKFISGAHDKLKEVEITNLDFEKVIKAPSDKTVMLYLDPPYYHADQKRAYKKSFELKDHQRLAKALMQTEHYFCLSYDDCEEVRKLYSWANIYTRQWLYNTANTNGSRMVGNELLITNYLVEPNGQKCLL
jgi:DNA adenine methylase